jgi:hypothetical protein
MVLERLREYVTTNDVAPNDDIFRWRQLQKSNCDARLMILYLDNVGFSSPAASPYQTPPSACIAAIYWSDLMFGHRGRVHVGPRLLRQLQAELQKEEASDNQAEGNSQADLQLWALFVGVYAGEKASVNVEMNRWYTIRFFVQASKMKLHEPGQIRAVLKRFLYSDSLQGEALETLVEKFGRSTGAESLGATKAVEMKEDR